MTAQEVSRLLKITRLSIPGLAKALGVEERTIYRYLAGTRECKGAAALLLTKLAEEARLSRKPMR